ncbi:malate dehydrogenase [Schlesneria paludicola]|uniref:malate dehydrogenase n=1 Tax=Schlesneria paludicola TaxID=360056 RepID=UPI00029A6D32|nr:malate dehydrogenase [Schlesneria paludicola]
MKQALKIAISGAAGRVGYGLAFRIAAGAMFGDQQPVILSLLETPVRLRTLQGIQLELTDCAFPLLKDSLISDSEDEAFADADWIIMLAATEKTLSDYSRLDLLRANGPIYESHGQAIERVAPRARVLVVTEPCNTLCLVVQHFARSVPAEHFFSLNRIDRMRATAIIAATAGVPVSRVNRVNVWGNRSDKLFVDFHNSYIDDQPAEQIITEPNWHRDILEPLIARRTQEVMSLLDAPPAATATQAIVATVNSISTPTPFQRRFGAGVVSDGSYGVPSNMVFGFPLRTEDGVNWSIVQGLYLDEYALARVQENIAELHHEATVAGL